MRIFKVFGWNMPFQNGLSMMCFWKEREHINVAVDRLVEGVVYFFDEHLQYGWWVVLCWCFPPNPQGAAIWKYLEIYSFIWLMTPIIEKSEPFILFRLAPPWGRAVKFLKSAEHHNICSKFYSDSLRCSAPKPNNISVRCTLNHTFGNESTNISQLCCLKPKNLTTLPLGG